METLEQIRSLTETILTERDDKDLLRATLSSMQDIYSEHTGIKATDFSEEYISLPSGVAISPLQAADCLVQMERTVVFLRGVYKALLDLRQRKPGSCINVLYAGCGPYATLLTPFTCFFQPHELQFWLMDISPESVESVKRMYDSLGIGNFVSQYLCTDAATYSLPADTPFHLVISETMRESLWQEPQVAIMLNLIPQMDDDAVFIPGEITVSVQLLTEEDNRKGNYIMGDFSPETIPMGTIYTIGRREHEPQIPVVLRVPPDAGSFTTMHLFTHITVYADEKLYPYNCTLNAPVWIDDVTGQKGRKVRFTYEHSGTPQFRHEWLPWF